MSNMQISALRRMAFAGVLIRIATSGCIGDATSDNSTDSLSGRTVIDSAGRKAETPAGVDREKTSVQGGFYRGYIRSRSVLRLKLTQNHMNTYHRRQTSPTLVIMTLVIT